MGRSENPVVAACLEYLRAHGACVWRNNTGMVMLHSAGKPRPMRFGHPGSPDIVGCLPGGRFVGVECKRPKGPRGGVNGSVQSPEQCAFQADLERAGGLYILARSINDLEAALPGGTP